MTADEIIRIAEELDCGPSRTAVAFARMIAEHCAQLAEECPSTASPDAVASAIRTSFRTGREGK